MKRKILIAILSLAFAACLAAGLTACSHTHTLTKTEATAAACNHEGNTEYWYCQGCDTYFADENGETMIELSSTVIPKTEHTWNNGEITAQPTCTEEGVKTYTCTVCGESKTEAVSASGHYYNDENICNVCGIRKPSEGLQYTFNTDDNTYTVSGIGTCEDLNIVIPSTYNGYPVTTIGYAAFFDNDEITGIEIPDSITFIDIDAFNECDSLTYYEYENAYYLGNYYNHYLVLVKVINTYADSYTINENTKFIYSMAFWHCNYITEITIPDSVIQIGDYAFSFCYNLESITIPDTVKYVCWGAFFFCTGLESVVIGSGVTHIGYDAFRLCKNLTSVTFKNTSGWYAVSVEDNTTVTILGSDISSSSTAAEYLSTYPVYCNYNWYRSNNYGNN